jgi:parvulin-like peptidyl-prolyl isomerase
MLCRRWYLPLLLALLVPFSLWGQEPTIHPSKDRILAKAGNRFISQDEFVRRFELLPGLYRRKGQGLEEEKQMVMYSLIAEKLLAQEAEDRGIAADSEALAGVEHLRDLLARDELYREEVAAKVNVSAEEIRQGVRQSARKLFLQYLYFPHKEDAEFVASQLRGKDLRSFAVDSTIPSLRDTITVEWGNAEPEIEKVAFSLKKGEISPVIETSQGFVIIQLIRESPDGFYMGMQPSVRRERVLDHLRLVKEEARLRHFMAGFLPGRTGYAIGPMIKKVALAVSRQLERVKGDTAYALPVAAKDSLENVLRASLEDTLMVAGTRVFTVADVLNLMMETDFHCPSKNALVVAGTLNARCRVWVQQELLAQEAVRRGLDRDESVRSQLQEWRDAYLAQLMRARIESGVTLDDAEVYRYLQHYGEPLPIPRVQVRQLTTATLEEMRQAMAALERGMPMGQVVRLFSRSAAERATGGLSGFFPITDRPPIGDLAAGMKPGQLYGPIPMKEGIVLFQLVARRDSVSGNATLLERKEQTATDLRRVLEKDAVEKFIAAAAAKRGFAIYQDQLTATKVSPIPMMTFRVLGFGGRLFAAPMLPRLFGWVTKEPPTPSVAP